MKRLSSKRSYEVAARAALGRGRGAAGRVARILLALTVAGRRGMTVRALYELTGSVRQTVYRDIARIEQGGWRLEHWTEQGAEGWEARYALAKSQALPMGRSR